MLLTEPNRKRKTSPEALGRLFLILVVLLIPLGVGRAQPPEGADLNSPKAALYRDLKDSAGMSCCSVSDCRPTETAYIKDSHWVAVFAGEKILIPDDKVVHSPSPEGANAVICLRYEDGRPIVRCFVPQSMG